MELDRTGIILYVLKYQECVSFYEDILGLEKLFTSVNLTCFALGDSYLMVELDDEHIGEEVETKRIRTCLRLNVADVRAAADKLLHKSIKVDYQEHEWGTVAKFFDPDGNLIAFKDSPKFEIQIASYK